MTSTARLYPQSASLADLSEYVTADEAGIGVLKALGHSDSQTAAVYEYGMPPDTGLQILSLQDPPPAGATKICVGYVWDAGQPAHVAAYRLPA